MKAITKNIMLTLLLFCLCCSKNENNFPVLQGDYLGQNPPGDEPEIFAPGIVSSIYWEHSGAVFSPDGNELFWTRAINEGRTPRMVVIMHMKRINDIWSKPELAPFNQFPYSHINSISPDGKKLYLFSENKGGCEVIKTDTGWGKPEPLRLNNSEEPGRHINEIQITNSGNLYLYGPLKTMPGGRGIVYSKYSKGEYQNYEDPGPDINFQHESLYPNHSPTVDPDERFIIFVSRRPGGFGEQDLYISFRNSEGTWGSAINLGEKINTVGKGNSWPKLSPGGKYLFFTSYDDTYNIESLLEKEISYNELIEIQESIYNGWGNIYWVSTSFIEELRTE